MLQKEEKSHGIRHYYLVYTGLTVVLVLACVCHFWLNGKLAIGYHATNPDGYSQHLTGLVFYAQWLKAIIKKLLFEHVLEIPAWSFQIGYGADVLTTLQFYVVGDPFALPVVFVPTKWIPYFYEFSSYARVWCAGLAFSAWCLKSKRLPEKGVLAGAISYAFCAFALTSAVRHPNFVTPMVWLPLLFWGIDKIRRGERPWLFLAMVCIAAATNLYFFYVLVVLSLLYGVVELLVPLPRKQGKETGICIAKLFGYGIIGVLLASVMLVPELMLLFGGSRISTHVSYGLFYPIQYYESFVAALFTYTEADASSWSNFGFAAPAILAVIVLYLDKEKSPVLLRLKLAFAVLTLLLMFPVAQSFFNGMSYPTARWHFGYSLLVAVILAFEWERLFALDKWQLLKSISVAFVLFCICLLLDRSRTVNAAFQLGILVFTLALLQTWEGFKISTLGNLVVALTMISVVTNALFGFSALEGAYVTKFMDKDQLKTLMQPEITRSMSKEMKKENSQVSRYSFLANDSELKANQAMLCDDVYSTGYYWSLQDASVSDYSASMLVEAWSNYVYTDPDRRTFLMELGSVRYAQCDGKDELRVPFGFEKDVSNIYKNQYALPLGYSYDSYISESELNKLSSLDRQEVLLRSIALSDAVSDELSGFKRISGKKLRFSSQIVPFSLSFGGNGVSETTDNKTDSHAFVVTQPGSKVTLNFKGIANAETYLAFSNLRFKGFSKLRLYTEDRYFDPLNLYGGLEGDTGAKNRWNELSLFNQKEILRADKYYTEPTRFRVGIKVNNSQDVSIERNFSLETPKYSWYNGRKDFLVNLYYDKNPKTSITITFPERGIYSFDDMSVLCQPMDTYVEDVAKLSEDTLQDIDLHSVGRATNKVTGSISLKSDKILCLSIPYSKGWTASVDGKEAKLFQANIMYMGIPLRAGSHKIELRYETPGIRFGAALSGLGVAATLVCAAFGRRKKSQHLHMR